MNCSTNLPNQYRVFSTLIRRRHRRGGEPDRAVGRPPDADPRHPGLDRRLAAVDLGDADEDRLPAVRAERDGHRLLPLYRPAHRCRDQRPLLLPRADVLARARPLPAARSGGLRGRAESLCLCRERSAEYDGPQWKMSMVLRGGNWLRCGSRLPTHFHWHL